MNFKLTIKEAATICAEITLRLQGGELDKEDRDDLLTIMGKLSKPFGFTPDQLMALSGMLDKGGSAWN